MSAQTAYREYKQIQVKTANREKLLIMLYQGCIKFLKFSKKSIEENNIEAANNYILRSQDIIRELMNTLDREKGGEIADNLYNLYDFMYRELIIANIKKDAEKIEMVEEMMSELLESWQQIANVKKKKPKLNVNK
ncbi:MAG: flagellar export chaperone FliS [Halanaerobium sp.]